MADQRTNSPEGLIEAVDEKITAIRTQSLDLSFNELSDMYRDGELIIDPEFQRMFRWSEGKQSRFIESLMLELPLPPIFLIEREDRVYELIDGLQRISSYLHFRGQLQQDGQTLEPLVLSDCDIVHELNSLTYSTLPRALEIKLKRSYIRAEILRKESDPRLRYYMFKRLNTGGLMLSEQEVRNATIRLLSNDFNNFLMQLSVNPDFNTCIDIISENARRERYDQELVLRFFAFKNNLAGFAHDVGDFLTDYMEGVSDLDRPVFQFDYPSERSVFEKTFAVLIRIAERLGYGSRIFGTIGPTSNEPRSQFSVYHYEGISLGLQAVLAHVDETNADTIGRLAEVVQRGKTDPEFLTQTGGGKNFPGPLRSRISFFARGFEQALAP